MGQSGRKKMPIRALPLIPLRYPNGRCRDAQAVTVCYRLRRLLWETEISMAVVAEALEVLPETVSSWVQGRSVPSERNRLGMREAIEAMDQVAHRHPLMVWRRACGVSQQELADAAGVSTWTVWAVENGIRRVGWREKPVRQVRGEQHGLKQATMGALAKAILRTSKDRRLILVYMGTMAIHWLRGCKYRAGKHPKR